MAEPQPAEAQPAEPPPHLFDLDPAPPMVEVDASSVGVFLTTALLGIVVALFLLRRSRSDRRVPTEQHAMAMEDVCLTSLPRDETERVLSLIHISEPTRPY